VSAKNATPRVQLVQDVQLDTQPGGNRGAVSGAGGTPILPGQQARGGEPPFRAGPLRGRLSNPQRHFPAITA